MEFPHPCVYREHQFDDKSHGQAFAFNLLGMQMSLIDKLHGPARAVQTESLGGLCRSSVDMVYCMRCLSWPTQAADWPTRLRNYDWPDSATVDHVVNNGCDVVEIAHRRCRGNQSNTMHRLSFSRAEVVLLNSWIRVQQIVYHMLRVFVKVERLTESANNSDAATLSNYNIKTLMLWACELKPRSWWIDDLNLVRLSVELLHILGVWLTDVRCPHYFIDDCNLFGHPDDWDCSQLLITGRLMSETETSLAEWFINNYIHKLAELCPDYISKLIGDVSNMTKMQMAVSLVAEDQKKMSLYKFIQATADLVTTKAFSANNLTVSTVMNLRGLLKCDKRLYVYFLAVTFLNVAQKTTGIPLSDELLDVLATTCLQSKDARSCMRARYRCVQSLSQATKLMKVVANNSRSTVQLIEIELSKAYLYRALACKYSDSDSIYCLANVYLAVLYYTTGQYQTAIDHCTLVMRSQDHSQCSSHVVQGELLPKIDDDIDNVLGLSVFYQYVRTAALNQQQQTQHVSVFTTELFAHYLHMRCLSVTKCSRFTQTSSTEEVQRYHRCFRDFRETFTTDLLLLHSVNCTKYPASETRQMAVSGQTTPEISHQLDTSKLVELLQQSAVEHLTTFRQLEALEWSSLLGIVTSDFEALYAYKRCEYQHCLQLSAYNVRSLIGAEAISCVLAYPQFIQLMDDDMVSLIGLTLIVSQSWRLRSYTTMKIDQLILSLYLMAQCQIKLRHSLTSLAQTLHYVKAARQHLDKDCTLDQLLLKLTERKILMHAIEA